MTPPDCGLDGCLALAGEIGNEGGEAHAVAMNLTDLASVAPGDFIEGRVFGDPETSECRSPWYFP